MKYIAIIIILNITMFYKVSANTIYKSPSNIYMDGKHTEPAWGNAVKIPTKYFQKDDKLKKTDKIHTIAQYCWDSNYLYIGYETFDSDMFAYSQGITNGPDSNPRSQVVTNPDEFKNVDFVKFIIKWDASSSYWELHHNANNDFTDIWCDTSNSNLQAKDASKMLHGIYYDQEQYIEDYTNKNIHLRTGITLKPKRDGTPSTINYNSDIDTGYTAELRIPIASLALPKKMEIFESYKDENGIEQQRSLGFNLDKSKIRILAVVQDMTSENRYHWSGPTLNDKEFHKGVKDWNSFNFSSNTKSK